MVWSNIRGYWPSIIGEFLDRPNTRLVYNEMVAIDHPGENIVNSARKMSSLVGSNVNLFFVAKFQEMIRKNLEEMGLPLETLNSLKLRIVDNGLEM